MSKFRTIHKRKVPMGERTFSKKQIRFLGEQQLKHGVPDRLSAKEIESMNIRERQLLLKNQKLRIDFPKHTIIGFKKGGEPVFAV